MLFQSASHFPLPRKKNKNRRTARELATTIASGELDIPAKSRKRNSRLQQQVRPRQRRRTDDAYEPPPVDPIEYSFCAIDPNHKFFFKKTGIFIEIKITI
ncbi:hypothetical protein P9112_006873 [Eukaryota sp. TZLM1-RC]